MHYQKPRELCHLKNSYLFFFSDCSFILITPISCLDLNVSEKGRHPTKEREWSFILELQSFIGPNLASAFCYKALECCFAISKVITLGFPEFFMHGGCHRDKDSLVNKLQSLKNKIGFGYKSSFQLTKLCSPPHQRTSFTSKMVNTDLH